MNQQRTDLALLVKAMKGGEKRYFRNFSKAFTADEEHPLYLNLFDLLENGNSELQNHFKGTSSQSLTTTRKRLYHNILKSLRLFHADKSANITIQNLLADVEILYNHSLPEQGLSVLQKAYGLAVQQEIFGLWLQCLEWESRLNVVFPEPLRPQEEILAEEESVLRKMKQHRQLESIYRKVDAMKRKYGYVKGELKKELEGISVKSPDMVSEKACLSQKAVYYRNFIHALYYWMTYRHNRAFEYSRKLVFPIENPIPPGDYIVGLLEHITACVCLVRFNDALMGIQLGNAFIEEENLTQSHTFTARMFAYQSTYEMVIHGYTGNRNELKRTIRFTEERLKYYDSYLPFINKHVCIGNLMNAYVGIGDLKSADRVWDSLFNKQSKDVRRDIYADLFLFKLFLLLHGREYELLPQFAASAVRYYRRVEKTDYATVFKVEYSIALLLSKAHDYNNKATLNGILKTCSSIVQKFIKEIKAVNGFQEHYTRYIIWCDAILDDEQYYIAAKRWYEGFTE